MHGHGIHIIKQITEVMLTKDTMISSLDLAIIYNLLSQLLIANKKI